MIKKNNIKLFSFIFLSTVSFYSPLHGMDSEEDNPKPPIGKNIKALDDQIKELEEKIPDLAHEAEPNDVRKLTMTFHLLGKLHMDVGDEYAKECKEIAAANTYNEAALFYTYVISMIKNNGYLKDLNETIKPDEQLNIIHRKLVKAINGDEKKLKKLDMDNFAPYKLLTMHRDEVKEEIKLLDEREEAYIEKSRKLFQKITEKMKAFLAQLYINAEEVVGKAPEYSIIGLGSLALQQMTPYSDLEFAILTRDEKDKPYFKKLSQLVHFYVLNLGETILSPDKYKCDTRHLVRKAVNFDLGGKTPLGRLEGDKPYELVCTVDKMLQYMYNKDQKSEHIDATLPYILQKTCFVHGSQDLFNEYNGKVKEFLKEHGESRAVKMLWEGCCEIDYINHIGKAHKTAGNINQFAFDANLVEGRIFNVKQEIYRLPDRFIYNFGLVYGIDAEDNWDTLTQLAKKGLINETAEANLKQALTFATNLRLRVYSHYGYHKDEMDYDEDAVDDNLNQEQQKDLTKKNLVKTFTLDSKDLQEDSALYKYYYVTRVLTWKLKQFCLFWEDLAKEDLSQEKSSFGESLSTKAENDVTILDNRLFIEEFLWHQELASKEGTYIKCLLPEKSTFFKDESFYDDSSSTKAEINSRLFRIEPTLKYQELKLGEFTSKYGEDSPLMSDTYHRLGITYRYSGNYEKARQYFEKALKTERSVYKLCQIYVDLGIVWKKLGDNEKCYEYSKKSLEKQKNTKLFNKNNPNDLIINTYHSLGITLAEQHKFEEALRYTAKSLKMSEQKYGRYHPLTLHCYIDHIAILAELGREKDALHSFNDIFTISKKIYSKNHYQHAIIYSNIGKIYKRANQNEKALDNYQKALEIWEKKLGINHPDVASTYNRIAWVYYQRKEYNEALNYGTKGLKIREENLGQEHPDTVSSYVLMADILNKKKQYQEALMYGEKALDVMEKKTNKDCGLLTDIYLIIWQIYFNINKHEKALYCLQKALEYNEKRWGKDHPTTAKVHTSLTKLLCFYGKDKEALGPCSKALAIRLKGNNSEVADSYKNMAVVFLKLKYVSKAKILMMTSEKIQNKEKPFYMQKWEEADNVRVNNITADIAPDLEWVSQDVYNGYKNIKNKKEQICKKYKNKYDQEIVKMLCFEAICLGVAEGNLKATKALDCLKQFCRENLGLVNKIAELHPEYFVEEEIIRKCIKNFPAELKSLEILLQESDCQVTEVTKLVDKKNPYGPLAIQSQLNFQGEDPQTSLIANLSFG